MNATEGTISFRGHETWYRLVGDGEAPGKLPLLCLHGGPGAEEQHVRFSVWNEEGRAEAAVSLDEGEALRLARFVAGAISHRDVRPTLVGRLLAAARR